MKTKKYIGGTDLRNIRNRTSMRNNFGLYFPLTNSFRRKKKSCRIEVNTLFESDTQFLLSVKDE